MAQYIKDGNKDTATEYSDADLNWSAIPGGTTFRQQLENSGYSLYNPSQQQTPKQPSLTVSSSDLVNRPLVQQPAFSPPPLPTYNTSAPVYNPPAQMALPEMPKLNQISLGPAPTVQSQDEILQQIQNRIKPLSDQEQANIRQGVDAAFAPQLADQGRVNAYQNLAAKAAAAQRGDLGFGTSELSYTGMSNVQQSGVDALGRLRAAQVAEQNTRLQAANETNRQNQMDLLNQANQLRSQQQQEAQTYVNNQMAQNDAALSQYKIQIDNTRYANEQERQKALDQFDALKYQNDLKRQEYQDQVQAYGMQRDQAKDTLAMISELSPQDMASFGDLSSLESSIGLPAGYVSALQRTKLASVNAKTQEQITDVYNQGVQLALSLPVGQSFSLKNPDGSTTTFTGTKPDEFDVINDKSGMWRVNKTTGELTKVQSYGSSSPSSSPSSGNNSVAPLANFGLPNIPVSNTNVNQPTNASSLGLGVRIGALLGSGAPANQATQAPQPNVDISKFDPQIQLIIKGQTSYDKLPAKERTRLANQFNQAVQLGLLNSGNASYQPKNKDQADAAGFAERVNQSNSIFNSIEGDISKLGATNYFIQSKLPSSLQNSTVQQQKQAEANFLTAVLRRESGAAISDSEFSTASRVYFPQPGDSAKVLAQKKASRDQALKNLETSAGPGFKPTSQSNSSSGVDSIKNQYGISY